MILHKIFFVAVALNPSTILSSPVTGIIKLFFINLYYKIAELKIRLLPQMFKSMRQKIFGKYISHLQVIKRLKKIGTTLHVIAGSISNPLMSLPY